MRAAFLHWCYRRNALHAGFLVLGAIVFMQGLRNQEPLALICGAIALLAATM